MHFERVSIARLAFTFLGFVTATASNIRRHNNAIVPATAVFNNVKFRYINKILERQQELRANFRAEFTEIQRRANKIL